MGRKRGLHLPTAISIIDGRLVLADAWNHRVLVWEGVPSTINPPPDYVLGQPDLSNVEKNRGGDPSAISMYWPFDITWLNGQFFVADTGNRRVLVWNGFPQPGAATRSHFGSRWADPRLGKSGDRGCGQQLPLAT